MITLNTLSNESLEPINIGISIFSRSSSLPGSPTISLIQPLITGRLFSAAGVLIGAQFLLLLTKYIFKLEAVPVLDVPKNKIIQIPIGELQALLQALGSRQNGSTSGLPLDMQNIPGLASGVPTILPPEAPLVVSVYIAADYSTQPYTPSTWLIIPILSFPGLRGTLPALILALLQTIFVRCVVPPETTGSKPLPKPAQQPNPSLNLHPEDLLGILNRFGKYFNSH